MRSGGSKTLADLETILASALYASNENVCSLSGCGKWPVVAARTAREVVDTLAWEWGGQQFYIRSTDNAPKNGRFGESALFGEEFLSDMQRFLTEELEKIRKNPPCEGCAEDTQNWLATSGEAMGEVYMTFKGQGIYIAMDIDRRNRRIWREYAGNNLCRLARKYRVSVSGIYKILKRFARERNAP